MFTVEPKEDSLRCTACGSAEVIRRGEVEREFHTLSIGFRQVTLQARIPRLGCLECGVVRQAAIGFAEPRRTYTKSFERYVLELSQSMTILDVAVHLNVSWDIVKDIQKRHLNQHFSKPKLKHLKRLAIDEIAIGKGHRYLTVVLDLESGAVVFVGNGKGGNALWPFRKRLRASHAKIEAVATDMSPAYIDAVTTYLPEATLVFDRFHVMKLYNDKLSQLRRDLQREATAEPMKKSIKGTRWLLIKNPENLDATKNEHQRLADALKASPEFLLFMSVATVLASIGLLQDSPAVIIGAMLVAPLMTPLLGAGLAMIQGNRPLFLAAGRAILIGVCVSFTIGMTMGVVSAVLPAELFAGSGLRLTNTMISRSHPNLLDPLIGFAAGLAGGFAIGRDKKIGALAGVAIAAALVPPIATAGLEMSIVGAHAVSNHGTQDILQLVAEDPAGLLLKSRLIDADHKATHNVHLFFAPLALFLMNACTVILGAFLGVRLVGMHRTMYLKESQLWVSVAALVLMISLLCLLMLVPIVAFYAH